MTAREIRLGRAAVLRRVVEPRLRDPTEIDRRAHLSADTESLRSVDRPLLSAGPDDGGGRCSESSAEPGDVGLGSPGQEARRTGARRAGRPAGHDGRARAGTPGVESRTTTITERRPRAAVVLIGRGPASIRLVALAVVEPAMEEIVDGQTTWRFDKSFLASNGTCIWGRGCMGILAEPAESLGHGCCSIGADLDGADEARLLSALAATRRFDGVFVPALPREVTGHAERELYGLGDVVAVRVMRLLLGSGSGAAMYVARVPSRTARAEVAAELNLSSSRVGALLLEAAQERELLTRPQARRTGGELTDRARDLHAHPEGT